MIGILVGAAAFVLLAGYFSGVETGIYSINRLRVRFRAERGQRGAAILQRLVSDTERLVATTLVGHNLAIYAAAAVVTKALELRHLAQPEVVATALLTPFSFVLAELLPKDLFERQREGLMCPLAASVRFFTWLLWPIAAPLRMLVGVLLSALHRPRLQRDVLFSRPGLMFSLADANGLGQLTAAQRQMAQHIMQVEQSTVADACLPIGRVESVSLHTTPRELLERLRGKRYSRLPVYEADPSKIIGTVNVFDLLYHRGDVGRSLRPYVKPAIFLDQRTRLHAGLLRLRSSRQHIGIVVDGARPVGLVTLSDLVEQLVGKLVRHDDAASTH